MLTLSIQTDLRVYVRLVSNSLDTYFGAKFAGRYKTRVLWPLCIFSKSFGFRNNLKNNIYYHHYVLSYTFTSNGLIRRVRKIAKRDS